MRSSKRTDFGARLPYGGEPLKRSFPVGDGGGIFESVSFDAADWAKLNAYIKSQPDLMQIVDPPGHYKTRTWRNWP